MSKATRYGIILAAAAMALSGCQMRDDSGAAARAAGAFTEVVAPPQVQRAAIAAPREKRFTAYVTGYSWWDNTPRGSTAIARPVIHRKAGGIGTYDDPVTLAVGHKIEGSRQTLAYPEGTRFYIAGLRKYAIVEDVCGDGHRPQNGPCWSGKEGRPWLDIWVDGSKHPRSVSDQCMRRLTRFHQIIQNPAPDYPVVAGPMTESGCPVFAG